MCFYSANHPTKWWLYELKQTHRTMYQAESLIQCVRGKASYPSVHTPIDQSLGYPALVAGLLRQQRTTLVQYANALCRFQGYTKHGRLDRAVWALSGSAVGPQRSIMIRSDGKFCNRAYENSKHLEPLVKTGLILLLDRWLRPSEIMSVGFQRIMFPKNLSMEAFQ